MKNNSSERSGRDIVPSARKSIHSHGHCPFASSLSMGVYGLHPHKNSGELQNRIRPAESDKASIKGTDEVDNILSKHKFKEHNIHPRRNSFDLSNIQQLTSDSDDVFLAKSLPSSLPSYSLCREWIQDNENKNNLDTTVNTSSHSENLETPIKHNNSKQNSSQFQERAKINTESTKSVIWAPLIVVALAIIVTYHNLILGTKQLPVYDESRFYNDISNIGGKYRINQDSLLQVQTGISTIFERQDTGSFIFVYNSNLPNFNYQVFDDVLDRISHTAAKYLRNDTTTVRHLVVENSDLDMRTTSELINRYKDDVTKTGVMLIKDIDGIPSSLAMAFHYYCDEYNPLVKKSAIFFTLDLARCQYNSMSSSIHALIEKCLTTKWNRVPSENIKPLLSRVVSVVVDLTSI